MSIIQGHAKSSGVQGFYPTTIDQSLRFEDGDSAYLSWTPASAGNRKTWTFSAWVKKGNVTEQALFDAYQDDNNRFILYVNNGANGQIRLFERVGGTSNMGGTSTAYYRDPSAWYHIVFSMDTTQATASDRFKIYVNGQEIALTSATYPSQNYEPFINAAVLHSISSNNDSGGREKYFDGYMAEVHFTDGTAYTADAFGELKSGIWVAKSPSVTYGTNGFYLAFGDSAAIGDDTSGNGNDWTVNNLVASDVVPDSPTNNFCTLNPVEFVNNSGFLSEGNLKISDTSSANLSASGGTIGMKSGKWYWEAHLIVQENGFNIGVVKDTESATSGTWNYTKTNFYAINGLGTSYVSDGAGAQNAAGTSFAQGDTVQVAYDADTGKLYFGKNGTWLNSADPAAGTGNLETTSDPEYGYHPVTSTIGDASGYSDVIMNFGQDDTFAGNLTAVGNTDGNGIGSFKYTVPSGFLALCTSNLPDPVIDPAQDATPADHFNVIAYAGSGSQSVTGVGFQPDLVWVKGRTTAYNHQLHDVVRGATAGALFSNSTVVEQTAYQFDSFDSDGFTTDSANVTGINNTGQTFVAWNWKAGGTGVSNTDGSITSTVSANTDAGFSIVSYTGNGTAGATVGHGLSSAPEMVITKERGSTGAWPVYHVGVSSAPETDYFFLNATDQVEDSNLFWNDTSPSSSVVTVGSHPNVNRSTENIIMYCFHSVDGFSKVGSYVGNGNSDGPFVYCGFRPKWIMIKNTANATNWNIIDTERNTYNVIDNYLEPNTSAAEGTYVIADALSNGFKPRFIGGSYNDANDTHVYLAFAEQPFKYSNAR